MISVRAETADDHAAIRAINRSAFAGDDEAGLIDRLRADGDVIASLVACDGAEIVGHILFSRLAIDARGRAVRGAALAPMAVRPDRQRRGIGAALVRAGLDACRAAGVDAVVVLGHPAYYPRFGFSAEAARALAAPFSGAAFMVLALSPGALDGTPATVHYAPAFDLDG